jgi:aminoglycoside 3-N-acetyltransferase
MPTHSTDLSDPEKWSNPPVPKEWCAVMREEMPPFFPDMTPTNGVGVVPECFRGQHDTLRSCHPSVSWAAWGKNAKKIIENHALSMSQGETSPLARLYELGAYVLLFGVGFESNTCFHLAEYRSRFAKLKKCQRGAPTFQNGQVLWTLYDDIYWYDADFAEMGACFETQTPEVTRGYIGQAESLLFPLRAAVDFAVDWMNENRSLD